MFEVFPDAVQFYGAKTCANPSHIDWHRNGWAILNGSLNLGYIELFNDSTQQQRKQSRVEIATMMRQHLHYVQMPPLQGIPGEHVMHMFHAGTICCIMTIQWSCEYSLGWGKCYNSESAPQVFKIINRMCADNAVSWTSFIAYNNASDLLWHIVTQELKTHTVNGLKQLLMPHGTI